MPAPPGHTLIPVTPEGKKQLEILIGRPFINCKTLNKLHLLLRHSNLVRNCDTGGFFRVSFVLTYFETNLDKLVNTVYNNNKNRYEFSICDEHLYVRACQGHSGDILKKIIPEHIYDEYTSDENVFHRTTSDVSDKIFSSDNATNGLRPIGRQVHMATSEELARKSDKFPIKIIVDVKMAREHGVVFWQASNGVIISYNKIPVICLSI